MRQALDLIARALALTSKQAPTPCRRQTCVILFMRSVQIKVSAVVVCTFIGNTTATRTVCCCFFFRFHFYLYLFVSSLTHSGLRLCVLISSFFFCIHFRWLCVCGVRCVHVIHSVFSFYSSFVFCWFFMIMLVYAPLSLYSSLTHSFRLCRLSVCLSVCRFVCFTDVFNVVVHATTIIIF